MPIARSYEIQQVSRDTIGNGDTVGNGQYELHY